MAWNNNYNNGNNGGGNYNNYPNNNGGNYQNNNNYNRNSNGGNYQNNGGGGGNYGGNNNNNNNYRRNQNSAPPEPVKHSGARWIQSTKRKDVNDNAMPAILAWNVSRKHGMLSILISPYSGTLVHDKSGKPWENWMCSIEGKGIKEHFPVLVLPSERKAIIRNGWNWVVNCNARRKGYCGQYSR